MMLNHITAYLPPTAWEKAIIATWDNGRLLKGKRETTKDTSLVIDILYPTVSLIHKNLPCGIDDLEKYRQSVVFGTEDNTICKGKRDYTYHNRIVNYPGYNGRVNQLDAVIQRLATQPGTRRAQMVIWDPQEDNCSEFPPCLQIVHYRLFEDGKNYYLNTYLHWRSRDLYKAWYMNTYAFISLSIEVAYTLKTTYGIPVLLGEYFEYIDSAHIYEQDFYKLESEVPKMKKSFWAEDKPRVFHTIAVQNIIIETQDKSELFKDYYWDKEYEVTEGSISDKIGLGSEYDRIDYKRSWCKCHSEQNTQQGLETQTIL